MENLPHNLALAYFISEWVIRLAMLVVVPQRRTPEAARSWLLLIFVVPWVGLLLYGLIGRTRLPLKRIEMQQAASKIIQTAAIEHFREHKSHPDLPPQFAEAVQLAERLGDFPISGGNRVELIADYDGAIDALIEDIDAAEHSVHLLYYIFGNDRTGNSVAEALERAAARGVACRVLMDWLGSKKSRRAVCARLRKAGIEACPVLPVNLLKWGRGAPRIDLRNHRKIAVIDGLIAYVGSQNLVDADFKPRLMFEELVVRVTGPVVLQLQAVFLADRFFELETMTRTEELFPPQPHAGQTPSQVLPSGPGYPQANNQRLIVTLLYAALRRVVITTPYFIPDEGLIEALETAAMRGVEVHLVVSREIDQLLVGLAQRAYYEQLLEAGVKIHLYRERFLHAKHLSVDDSVVLIGSSNFDIRSFQLNSEVSLISYDAQVAADLREIHTRYFAGSEELKLEVWRARPLRTRVVQNIARLVDSLL